MPRQLHVRRRRIVQVYAGRLMRLALTAVFLLQSAACVSSNAQYQEQMTSPTMDPKVVLQPGDEIELKFPYWAELNDTQVIRPDGFITLQLIDSVQTKGLTPEELDKKLTNLYENKIKDPIISVVVRSLVDQRIYVGGEVNTPGLLTLQGEVSALQAIINAGGFNENARVDHVIVLRQDKKGEAVPYKVDLSKALYEANTKNTFMIQPNDVVFVPKTNIANINKFMQQYVRDLFMFNGVGLGFSWQLHSEENNR